MYMVYSETFILANTFDTYRRFNLAPRWSQLHENDTRFLLFCTSHFLMIRWATLGSYWPRKLSWALNSFVLFEVPRGNFTVEKLFTHKKVASPWATAVCPWVKCRADKGSSAVNRNYRKLTCSNNYNLLSPTAQDRRVKCLQKLKQIGIPGF